MTKKLEKINVLKGIVRRFDDLSKLTWNDDLDTACAIIANLLFDEELAAYEEGLEFEGIYFNRKENE